MTFTIQDIQSLRQKTGAGMMHCKKALIDSNGNIEEAENVLRESGMIAAAKKAERISADGVAYADIIDGKAVLLEINTETDFAAKSEAFLAFVRDVAEVIAEQMPADTENLLQCRINKNNLTVQEVLREKVLVYGEKIQIRRFMVLSAGSRYAYMHNNGRIGVILQIDSESCMSQDVQDVCKELTLQIASMNPEFVAREDIPTEWFEALKARFESDILNDPKYQNKPKALRDKILSGKIEKHCREKCLLEQAYIKDESITVKQFLKGREKEKGINIRVVTFARYEKGEGLHTDDEQSNEVFARELSKGKE